MSARNSSGVERRNFLKGIGLAGGAVAVGSAATLVLREQSQASADATAGIAASTPSGAERAGAPQRGAHVEPPPSAEVLALFGSIGPGTQLGRWQVVAVHDARMGGIPVTMTTAEGQRFQVDVVRRDADLAGVGNTAQLSVFVVNSGNGSSATMEEQGLGAMALADALARREAEGATVPRLLTLRERQARFPRGAYKAEV